MGKNSQEHFGMGLWTTAVTEFEIITSKPLAHNDIPLPLGHRQNMKWNEMGGSDTVSKCIRYHSYTYLAPSVASHPLN